MVAIHGKFSSEYIEDRLGNLCDQRWDAQDLEDFSSIRKIMDFNSNYQ